MGPPRIHLSIACTLAAIVLAMASHAASRPPRSAKPPTDLKSLIKALAGEAQEAISKHELPQKADAAQRFKVEMPTAELHEALLQSAHQDALVDAYVRWQLLSYFDELPEFEDAQFERLLTSAPRCIDNPRADEGIVKTFQDAERNTRPSVRDVRQLKEAVAELDRRTPLVEKFNRPAEEFRAAWEKKFEGQLTRSLLWSMENTAASIKAGWPGRTLKASLTRKIKSAAGNTAMDDKQREIIAKYARQISGIRRTAIAEVAFLSDGRIDVKYTTSSIDEDDVEKWIAILRREVR